MISFSLATSTVSISATVWSVAFCTCSAWRLLVVLADGAVLLELLQQVDAVAAHVADRDACLLGIFVRDLDHLLAALLVHLRDAQADDLAFGLRIEAEIGTRGSPSRPRATMLRSQT